MGSRPRIVLVLASILLSGIVALAPGRGAAHDVPGTYPVKGFFKQETGGAQLVLRVPLAMLLNVNLPKRGPGYLDLATIEDDLARASEAISKGFQIHGDGAPLRAEGLGSRISLPSDSRFTDYDAAAAAIAGPPLPVSENLFWNQGFLDVHLAYEAPRPVQDYSLRIDLPPGMAERTLVSLGILVEGEPLRRLEVAGTTAEIPLDPRWYQAGLFFLNKGVEHILTGIDHLLFLLCLILPLRSDPRRLAVVVTAFTIGHSVTLIPAALGMVPAAAWFSPLVESLIAFSIVWLAVENVLGLRHSYRWSFAFGFGLIHGFGFAATLGDVLQYAGGHLIASLVFFNIGIEIGQVLALTLALPVLGALYRSERVGRAAVIGLSVLAGHEGWHWMVERLGAIDMYAMLTVDPERLFQVLTWAGTVLAILFGLRLAFMRMPVERLGQRQQQEPRSGAA